MLEGSTCVPTGVYHCSDRFSVSVTNFIKKLPVKGSVSRVRRWVLLYIIQRSFQGLSSPRIKF